MTNSVHCSDKYRLLSKILMCFQMIKYFRKYFHCFENDKHTVKIFLSMSLKWQYFYANILSAENKTAKLFFCVHSDQFHCESTEITLSFSKNFALLDDLRDILFSYFAAKSLLKIWALCSKRRVFLGRVWKRDIAVNN